MGHKLMRQFQGAEAKINNVLFFICKPIFSYQQMHWTIGHTH
jgi:hypothetical protein